MIVKLSVLKNGCNWKSNQFVSSKPKSNAPIQFPIIYDRHVSCWLIDSSISSWPTVVISSPVLLFVSSLQAKAWNAAKAKFHPTIKNDVVAVFNEVWCDSSFPPPVTDCEAELQKLMATDAVYLSPWTNSHRLVLKYSKERARISNFNTHVRAPRVPFTSLPSISTSSPSTWPLTLLTLLTRRLHPSHSSLSSLPPTLLSSPSVPFTLIFHHSLRLPIPLFRGPTGSACYARRGIRSITLAVRGRGR